jgi:hypothetical protein
MKTCPKCGTNNADALAFCGSCGTDLADVPSTPGNPGALGSFSITPALIALVAAVLLAGLCWLVVLVVSLVDDSPQEEVRTALYAAVSLSDLFALLLAFGGAWLLVSRLDLGRFFTSPDALIRLLLILVFTGLLYTPLAFLMVHLFAFSPGGLLAISVVNLLQGILVVLIIAALYFLLRRQSAP